jgi:hypothetical protein
MTHHLLGLDADIDRRTGGRRFPGHGLTYTHLAGRHRRITERRDLTTKGKRVTCSARGSV